MKIVIDIPEEWFCRLQNEWGWALAENVREAIKSGTILPKGHGDLIDRTALMSRPYETGGFVEWYDEIKYAPTIIEADKEDNE